MSDPAPAGPAVSVIIPTFNRLATIRDAVDSVLEQPVSGGKEVIVVDDGSTDGTETALRDIDGLTLIVQENQGPSAARNRGLAAAQGHLVAFLDSDDIMAAGRLEAQQAFLKEHPKVDGVLGRQVIESLDGDDPPELPADPVFGDPGGINLITVMIGADWLRRVGGFDETLRRGEDRDLLFRLKESGANIEVLDRVVLIRRLSADSLTFERRQGPTLAGMVAAHLRRARQAEPVPTTEEDVVGEVPSETEGLGDPLD